MTTPNNTLEAQLEHIKSRGIEGSIVEEPMTDANGNPVLDQNGKPIVRRTFVVEKIPAVEYEVNKFFAESIPCWFAGCEELRRSYKAELAALSANGKGCTGCAKGKVMRKYWPMVKAAIQLNEQGTNTGAKQVSGSGTSSTAGAKQKQSLLRRASAGLASLFSFGRREGA